MKGLKELPSEHICIYASEFNNKKGYFYIGRTRVNDRFGGTPVDFMYKLGVTSNLENRLIRYKKVYADFEYIKTYYIKNYKILEELVKSNHRKNGVFLYFSEYFTDSSYPIEKFIEDVEWYIHNTYYEKRKRFYPAFLSKWEQN